LIFLHGWHHHEIVLVDSLTLLEVLERSVFDGLGVELLFKAIMGVDDLLEADLGFEILHEHANFE
jgi:hypothetical protein